MSVPPPRKPRVFALEPLHSEGLALARKHFDLILPTDDEFDNWREEAEGLLARNAIVSAEDITILAKHRLKFIAKQGVGVDNFDLDALALHGLPLMNTPGVNAIAVAEMAMALLTNIARGVCAVDHRIRRGNKVTKLDGWSGQTLTGKTLGVIGGGNIGRLFASMFHGAYQGDIVLYDPYLHDRTQWDATIPRSKLTVVQGLDDLLRASDIVTVHVPLTKGTTNLIRMRELRLMRSNAILLNTARGGIINEVDLMDALKSGIIFGAGLDAFVHEPPSLAIYPALCELENVVMTPHFGAATEWSQQETCRSMVQHLVEAFQGEFLRDRVV